MKLSNDFDSDEFTCKDGAPVPDEYMNNLQELVDGILQPVRDRVGKLDVISGYRTKAWNDRKNGAKHSKHLIAAAADIRSPTMTPDELAAVVLAMRARGLLSALGGLGIYPDDNWIHVDTEHAPDGHLRRWRGAGVGSEQ